MTDPVHNDPEDSEADMNNEMSMGNGAERRKGRMSFLSAFTFWVVISFAGWAVIAGVVAMLTPEQASQIADEQKPADLKIAPASGPEPASGQ